MLEPFIGPEALESLESPVLADVRWYLDGRSGRRAYEAGHIPGAVFVDLDTVCAGPPSAALGRHPLPQPEAFASGLAALGIGEHDLVVAYDDAGGVIAARLVWMLRVTGHAAAVLDGGLGAYSGVLEQVTPVCAPAVFSARPWPSERLAEIADATSRSNTVLDARPRERYAGAPDALDPRAGHIPGALSFPCRENLEGSGRLVARDELRQRFEALGVREESRVVSYCGSGVTACHNLLALEHAGLAPGRLFPGSWSQYAADPTLPAATGEAPGTLT